MRWVTIIFCVLILSLNQVIAIYSNDQITVNPSPTKRTVAVTFDDLLSTGKDYDVKTVKDMTNRLLQSLVRNNVPTIGFVNEGDLYASHWHYQKRVKVLKKWVTNGFELGNHTYSHRSFYDLSLEEFQDEVIRGEKTARRLLNNAGKELRYFRYPYLNTGRDAATKAAFESFLAARGYRVAPVTIASYEWDIASAYAVAKERGDEATCQHIATEYIIYMDNIFAFYEKFSLDMLGREIPQILLIHSNMLNADHFDKLAQMMRDRGYQFISLDEALTDSAYSLPDEYYNRNGVSWMQRWAYTTGFGMRKEPAPPKFLQQLINDSQELDLILVR